MHADILKSKLLTMPGVLNIYQYGSHVYGCNDEESDVDLIVVSNFSASIEYSVDNLDFTMYDKKMFLNNLAEHEVSALECLYLPEEYVIKETTKFKQEISLKKLRHSISAKASNSFVKAKKKLTVKKDFSPRIGKKSLFHSLRIILFGIQIAKTGRIEDYTVANQYWEDIVNNPSDDWEEYRKTYKPEYNKLMTEFRKVAPK